MTQTVKASTPWGTADYHEKLAEGIDWYSTPSHGGVKLSPERNASIPELFRISDGWYEEDCDWAIACYFHPEGWVTQEGVYEQAVQTLKVWRWQEWEQFHGVELAPGESRIKDSAMWQEANKDKYQSIAAWGDWVAWVPDGMVGVIATIGGVRQSYDGPPVDEVFFLVPGEEYDARKYGSFAIDESRHQRIAAPDKETLHRSK